MPRCCWYANAHLPALHTQQRLVLAAAIATNGGEDYYYSSAKFYGTGIDDFGMLTHCDG
jgi:hypothetical protein